MAGTPFDDALALHQSGRVAEAEGIYRRVLQQQPDHPGALHLLGVVRQQQGDYPAALELIGRAIAINPNKAVYHNNYGAAFQSLGRYEEAVACFQRALAICPNYADALANLGMAQTSQGEEKAAEAGFRRALQIQPWHRDATTRLAAHLVKLGQEAEARRLLEAATAAAPCAEFHTVLGGLLLRIGSPEQAVAHYHSAVKLKPDDANAHFNLGNACQTSHDIEQARSCLCRAAELRPEKRLWRLRAELCGPVVFEDAAEINEYSGRLGRVLEQSWAERSQSSTLCVPLPSFRKREAGEGNDVRTPEHDVAPMREEGTRQVGDLSYAQRQVGNLSYDDLLEAGAFPGFALSYHGRNQRRLKEQLAAIYEPCFRDQPPPAGSGLSDRKRIGILVSWQHEGIFLRCMQGIVQRLDAERFEIVVLCSRSALEPLRKSLRRDNLQFAVFSDLLPEAIRQIRAAACDLIYYWEIGSDPMNYFLPFAHLAPVQCTSHGSLTTTGVPAVDYFYSSDLIETDAAAHYSERLWRSRTLLMYQERLPAVPTRSRTEWGLSESCHLYACLQNPLKLHPDFDVVLAGILATDPAGTIVLLADQSGRVASALRNRFARHFPGDADRIVFLPRQRFQNYCALLQAADVVLDPFHYGAGSTCYDIFSFNLPIVTMPTEMMPSRVAYGFYQKMRFEELVASSPEEYVREAVHVATNRDCRRYVTERIAGASDVLFNDIEVVREHERFFAEALTHVI